MPISDEKFYLLHISEKSEIMVGMDDELDGLLRALANSTRRAILKMVWNHEASAGWIAEKIDLAPASVSEHLKVLRKAGLVNVQKQGTSWIYTADRAAMQRAIQLLKNLFPG